MSDCTYRFTDAGGALVTIQGLENFKAYLAGGGLQHLMPGAGPVDQAARQARFSAARRVVAAWKDLAGKDGVFQYPVSDKKDLKALVADVSPQMEVAGAGRSASEVKKGISRKWRLAMPVDGRFAHVYENDKGQVWVDASALESGASQGSLLYAVLGNYAYNTGKVFVGDPGGLSDKAVVRRTEHMLSSALKFGTTMHLAPGLRQTNPAHQADLNDAFMHTQEGSGNKPLRDWIKPLQWSDDDDENLVQLVRTSYTTSITLAPELRHVTYDPTADQFKDRSGRPVQLAALLRSVSESAASRGFGHLGRSRPTGVPGLSKLSYLVGSATAKRVAVANTVLRQSDRAHLGLDGRELSGTQLGGILYSPARAQTESPEFKRWFGDSKVVDADGDPLVVYHGTHVDIAQFKKTKGAHLGFHFGDKEAANTRLEDTADSRIDVAEVARLAARSEQFFKELKAFEDGLHRKNAEVPTGELMAALETGDDVGAIFDRYRYQPTADETAELTRLRTQYEGSRLPIMKTGIAANIGAYYLSIKNPLRLPDVGNWGGVKAVKDALPWWSDARSLGQIVEEIKARGYDGIVYENRVENPVMRTDSYIAFSPEQIKSATGNNGQFDPANPDIRFSPARAQTETPAFYSPLSKAIESAKQQTMPGNQWSSWLTANQSKLGLKKDEIQWSGILDWLDLQGKNKVSKDEVLQYLGENGVQVQDVMMGGHKPGRWSTLAAANAALSDERPGYSIEKIEGRYFLFDETGHEVAEAHTISDAMSAAGIGAGNGTFSPTKYDQYTLPGGKNYRELLLTLPKKKATIATEGDKHVVMLPDGRRFGAYPSRADAESALNRTDGQIGPNFQSSHWSDTKNILAHIRFNERTDAEGKKVLFIEEIQSDWGQEGKKKGFDVPVTGYQVFVDGTSAGNPYENRVDAEAHAERARKFNAPEVVEIREVQAKRNVQSSLVPAAPFVTDTKAWVTLALKRMMRYAADNGFDKIAFVNGEQSADRYDLSKQVDQISIGKYGEGSYQIIARKDGDVVIDRVADNEKELESLVGKDIAQKHIESGQRMFKGLDLKIGGGGMKTFYDQIVPQVASDLLKKLGGGKLGIVDVPRPYDLGEHYVGGKKERIQTKPLSSPQLGFAVPAVAHDALPLFSHRRSFGQLTPDQEASLRKVGLIQEGKTLRQRWAELTQNWQTRLTQGLVDQFAPLKELDMGAYVKARLSKGSDGTLEAQMLYGKVYMNGEVPDVRVDPQGGFARVLASLGHEQDRFFAWVAALRAERLKAAGLENLFQLGDIQNLKALNLGDAEVPDRAKRYADALEQLNQYNDAVLKVAEQSGLIDAGARKLFEGLPYVPFYRVMEDGVQGPTMSSGLVNQYAWKKMKGGTEQLNPDLLANTLLNWSHIFSAAAKNRAALAAMKAAEANGIAGKVPAGTKGAVKVLRDGVVEHWLVDDPYLFEAISALEYAGPRWFKPFSTAKKWLTWGVTVNPAFKIRNLIRDSVSAIGQAELSYNPFQNVRQGMAAFREGTQTHASMLAGGGALRFGTLLEGDRSTHARHLVRKWTEDGTYLDASGWERLALKMKDAYETYQELGDRYENANRAALYEQLLAKGYTQEDANFMARDLLDFSMSGQWPVVRFLAQVVPFLNARLQGLYKLGRAGKDNPRRMGYVTGAIILASLGLLLGYGDDDDWKQREDWDRDNYWWFKIGGTAFRIPKPFELGSIGTMAERTWEMFTDKEMTADRYAQRISAMVLQTFAMNPVPQIAKPLLDVYANKDSFSGREIESMGMARLRPEDRKTDKTSVVAEFLGSLGLPDPAQLAMGRYQQVSPVQVDYLLRAYFGWAGSSATTALDAGIRPMLGRGDRPDMRLKDIFFLGNFAETLPAGSSRYVTQMYQHASEVEQAYASWRAALKVGDVGKAQEILADNPGLAGDYKRVERQKSLASAISLQIRRVEANPLMPGDVKREKIDAMKAQLARIAEVSANR